MGGGGARVQAPLRLVLLDPFFSSGPKPYLNGASNLERGQRNLDELREALPALPIETYSSSILGNPPTVAKVFSPLLPTVGAPPHFLKTRTLFKHVPPAQLPPHALRGRHIAAHGIYFLSIAGRPDGGERWPDTMNAAAGDDEICIKTPTLAKALKSRC